MALASGTKIGPYEIQSLLGAGGMGEVYRARDTRLGRDVAIKILPQALAKDAERLRRFEQEARTIAALSHPNILGIHDIGVHDDAPFLVNEFLEGQTLREKLESGDLPQRRAIEYALSIANGLAAAHEKGIVHRDLKPENVFVTRDDRVKVLDFGLAKLVRPEERQPTAVTLTSPTTLPGMVMGTVGYMSPEQVKGEPSDARDLVGGGLPCGQGFSGVESPINRRWHVLKLTMEAAFSALTGVFLFTVWWCWYYLTVGWRWYLLHSTRDRETFFSWRYRVKVALIFVVVFVAVRQLGHP